MHVLEYIVLGMESAVGRSWSRKEQANQYPGAVQICGHHATAQTLSLYVKIIAALLLLTNNTDITIKEKITQELIVA